MTEAARPFFFCLASGAALGCLWLAFQALGILLRAGKLLTAFLDVLFCCLCAAAVFLCSLAVDKGRLRLFQAGLQLLGGWAAVLVLSPFTSRLAGLLRKCFCKVSGFFKRTFAFLIPHFRPRRRKKRKNRGKAGKKPEKAKKKT